MERIILATVLVAGAVVVAALLSRRRPDPPTQSPVEVPRQLDRQDFVGSEVPWLVAVFTSNTCESCGRATTKARSFAGPEIAYQEIPWQTRQDLHDRYRVTDVPMIVIADADGVVQRSFVGVPSSRDFEAAMAEVTARGSPD